MDGDSYSDPIDLITARENGKHRPNEYFHSKQSSGASRDSLFSDENYSTPIDILKSSAQSPKSVSSNDSNYVALPPPARPTKLEIRGHSRYVPHICHSHKSLRKSNNLFAAEITTTLWIQLIQWRHQPHPQHHWAVQLAFCQPISTTRPLNIIQHRYHRTCPYRALDVSTESRNRKKRKNQRTNVRINDQLIQSIGMRYISSKNYFSIY